MASLRLTHRLFSCRLQSAASLGRLRPASLDRSRRCLRNDRTQVFRFEYCYLLHRRYSFDHAAEPISPESQQLLSDIAVIDPKSKVLLTNDATLRRWQGNCLITLPTWFPASCVTTGKTHLMQIQPCRARRFPAFGCTNAFFTSLRLLYDYFAS